MEEEEEEEEEVEAVEGVGTRRCRGMELGRHAAGLGDVEVFASRDLELGRRMLRTCGHGGMEVYCRRADVEAQRYGALEVRCRRVASICPKSPEL